SVNRLKKCAKLQCNRSEFLKALRDVTIAVGAILVGRKIVQRFTQDPYKEWHKALLPGIRGNSLNSYRVQDSDLRHVISITPKHRGNATRFIVNTLQWMMYAHDPRFQWILNAGFDFSGEDLRGVLHDAINFHYTDAIQPLLDMMTPEQVSANIRGWTLYKFATMKQFGYKKAPNPYDAIVAILDRSPKVDDKRSYGSYSESERRQLGMEHQFGSEPVLGGAMRHLFEGMPIFDRTFNTRPRHYGTVPTSSPGSPDYEYPGAGRSGNN
ncbi:MAG TPA: hypothetical protein VI521_02980, partial [Candidatus Babeliales bacterium]|nr:hypothetical protein [Candidatus Babeliales bacterium]